MVIQDLIFVDLVGFLSMVIYVVSLLYTQCLRYNICSACFIDIRISTCFLSYHSFFHAIGYLQIYSTIDIICHDAIHLVNHL